MKSGPSSASLLLIFMGVFHKVTTRKNKLLLISINFTLKTSHSCLKKWYTMFSRQMFLFPPLLDDIFFSKFRMCILGAPLGCRQKNMRSWKLPSRSKDMGVIGNSLRIFFSKKHWGKLWENHGTPRNQILDAPPLTISLLEESQGGANW